MHAFCAYLHTCHLGFTYFLDYPIKNMSSPFLQVRDVTYECSLSIIEFLYNEKHWSIIMSISEKKVYCNGNASLHFELETTQPWTTLVDDRCLNWFRDNHTNSINQTLFYILGSFGFSLLKSV
jgi:hypothetical protein